MTTSSDLKQTFVPARKRYVQLTETTELELATVDNQFAESVRKLADTLYRARYQAIFRETDQLLAALIALQWIAAIALAVWISPLAWNESDLHNEHLRLALVLGGGLAGTALTLALLAPGRSITRYMIAVAQMLMSALLVQLTAGRIEMHFHLFGALVVLTLYRDWKVIALAAAVACSERFVRGYFWPEGVYGTEDGGTWRWLEHSGWILLEAGVLIAVCLRSARDLRAIADRCAALEISNASIEATVWERTEALRKSEVRLAQTIDGAMDAVISIDCTGRIQVWNQQAERIFGWSAQEALGRPLWGLVIPPRSQGDVERGLSRYLLTGESQILNRRLETVARHRDGYEVPIELSVSPIGAGRETAFSAFLRDISQRRKAQEVLSERARLADLVADIGVVLGDSVDLRNMLQSCTDSMSTHLDAAAVRLWIFNENDHTLELQASSGATIETTDSASCIPLGETKIGQVAVERRQFISNVSSCVAELFPTERFGLNDVDAVAIYPLVVEGRLVGVLALFAQAPFTEATIREMATIADSIGLGVVRKQAERQLRHAHKENKQLLESISSILITLDSKGLVAQWNRAAETTFGISAAEAAGRSLRDCGIRWQDRDAVDACIRSASNTAESANRFEFGFFDGRESPRFLDLTITRIESDDKQPDRLLLLGADTTEQKLLQTQFTQAQKLESIGQLAAGIAHEINTPIQYVGDNMQFLQAAFGELESLLAAYETLYQSACDGPVSETLLSSIIEARERADIEYLSHHVPKAVGNSLEGLNRVAHIVRAMKDFSHPGSEEKILTDINRAIESTATVTRNEWKYVAELELDLDSTLPGVPCLPGEFNQVLVNTIVNAAHAIAEAQQAPSAPKGKITITTRHDDSWMEVRVRDTGCGIPREIRHRIFDPFFTTKPVGRGTGQGLALAHHIIVKQHGGTIDFESEKGEGTTFVIRLPMSEPVTANTEPAHEPADCLC